jgi:hypothetical protein
MTLIQRTFEIQHLQSERGLNLAYLKKNLLLKNDPRVYDLFMKIDLKKKYEANPDALSKKGEDGSMIVILLNDDDFYFKVDGIASEIWKCITTEEEKFLTPENVYQEMLSRFNPPVEQFDKDFHNFYLDLLDKNLIIPAN